MRPFMAGNVPIGEGRPKICAPLTGRTRSELKAQARELLTLPVDIAEWRVDAFSEVFGPDGLLRSPEGSMHSAEGSAAPESDDSTAGQTQIASTAFDRAVTRIADTAAMLRDVLGDLPIIFTVRTCAEGGAADISRAEYDELIRRAASLTLADLYDVELFTEGNHLTGTIKAIHSCGAGVIGSSHDFTATPSEREIISRLERMREAGADICKIAVMPAGFADVLTLLSASLSMREAHTDTPLIAISMGKYGFVSRVAGEYFGSDITFASAAQASAPGQIGVKDCFYILNLIHEELKT